MAHPFFATTKNTIIVAPLMTNTITLAQISQQQKLWKQWQIIEIVASKLGGAGDRFGDYLYLCVGYANLPCVTVEAINLQTQNSPDLFIKFQSLVACYMLRWQQPTPTPPTPPPAAPACGCPRWRRRRCC